MRGVLQEHVCLFGVTAKSQVWPLEEEEGMMSLVWDSWLMGGKVTKGINYIL